MLGRLILKRSTRVAFIFKPLYLTQKLIHVSNTNGAMKVLVDTDPGVDDAVALGLLLSRKDIEVVGITCVRGNTNVDKTTSNTLKILEAFDRRDIPVFKGAFSPLLETNSTGRVSLPHEDGLGDVLPSQYDSSPLENEVAAIAINRIVEQFPKEVTVIALGPLTNLALAARLNNSLVANIKEIIVMGGNYTVSKNPEFNFYMDPLAAKITLEEFTCEKIIITRDVSRPHYISTEDMKTYCSGDSKKCKFMRKILEASGKTIKASGLCDAVAMAIALNREVILDEQVVDATVEISGEYSKGLMLITRWDAELTNCSIVNKIDVELYREMLLNSLMS